MIRLLPFAAVSLALLAGCRGPGEPPSGDGKGGPYLRCAPPGDDGVRETFKLPPLVITRDGYDLEIKGMDRGVVVLGLMAGLNEPGERTRENISFFLDRFRTAEVQAILVAGGVGLMERDVAQNLEALAAAPVPVLISPGAQESYDVLRDAVAAARKRAPQLIDMTLVRRARLGHISVISLPGYHNSYYLEAKERGCSYEPGDLSDVASLAETDRTTVLLSASPPRGKGPAAVDLGRGGVNIGDPALAGMMAGAGIGFGLFGHVYEAGGRATESDGVTPVAEGGWKESLFLQAGAVDAVPIRLADGGTSVGMAQIVEFSGPRGRFRTVMASPAQR
jgi:hypothetical protein